MREHEGAERLLPRREGRRAYSQCARADDWAEHGVVLANVGVRPGEGRRQSASHSACGGQRTSPTPCEYTCATSFSLPGASYPLALGTRTRAARNTEESARPRGRSCGGCARSDDHAPEKTAAKRKAYGEQTGRGRSHFAGRRPYHWPTKPRSDLEFRILGPLEVIRAQRPLPIGSPRQRALLGLLLAARERAHHARTTDRGALARRGRRRRSARSSTSISPGCGVCLSAETASSPLLTAGGGVRAACSARGTRRAPLRDSPRTGQQELACGKNARASVTLRDSLALWRGPALADLAFDPFAQSEIAHLKELRLTAIESPVEVRFRSRPPGRLVADSKP